MPALEPPVPVRVRPEPVLEPALERPVLPVQALLERQALLALLALALPVAEPVLQAPLAAGVLLLKPEI